MKVLAYCTRSDEIDVFNKLSSKYGHEVTMIPENFSPETAHLAKGYDGITFFVNCKATREALETIASFGVKYIATRGAGFNNIDLVACKELDIKVSNVPAYSPNAVSELTIGLVINLTRKIHRAVERVKEQNFELNGLIGTEVRNLTIGVIGTGRIGLNVIKAFSGFGCKIIANDIYESDEVKKYAEYKSLDEVYKEADIITLHCPLSADNYNMINDKAIEKMKNGVIIINVARGGLVDTAALVRGLKSQKISAAALDTYENEVGIFHDNHTDNVLQDEVLTWLLQCPNVILTPHYAFYTDEAVKNMVETTLLNIKDFELFGAAKNEIA